MMTAAAASGTAGTGSGPDIPAHAELVQSWSYVEDEARPASDVLMEVNEGKVVVVIPVLRRRPGGAQLPGRRWQS